MASFHSNLPRMPNGEPDLDVWLDEASRFSARSRRRAVRVFDLIEDPDSRGPGLALVELLLELKMDIVTVMAGMTLFAVQRGAASLDRLPDDVANVVAAALPLSATHVLSLGDSAVLTSESKTQADNVRRMLIALIDDPRVAVLKLGERIVALREAKNADYSSRRAIAREAMEFYAPLAGRLGIWQLKWNLEDLAFRYLYPDEFQDVVDKLDGRREERERQVEAIRQELEFRLSSAGIDAEVQGRAKHIYSIWRKMSHKAIDFSEVRDVQAVRVLVDRVEECYQVLGVVHTSWPHIPSEFDDYIANPKENGYRSIHTAVIGPVGRTLEVQIRTREMHEESELGLCAHWAYKDIDGNGRATDRAAGADGADGKVDWLRSVLEWHDHLGSFVGGYATEDRIFVTTPQGHVLDLSPNATPVDFAYRVHTEVGHRCKAAKVDGRSVPLNRRLATGECVEVETGDAEAPRREWLNPALGYVNTSRARSKIQAWFRNQLAESNISAGRALLGETAERLDLPADFETLAKRAGFESEDAMLLAVGVGDQLVIDLVKLITRPEANPSRAVRAPDEPMAGTGTVHAIVVRGRDREGLLRDVMGVIAGMSISVVAANARADIPGESATIRLDMHVSGLAELASAIDALRSIPNVYDVRRLRET